MTKPSHLDFLTLLARPQAERERQGVVLTDARASEIRYNPTLAVRHYREWQGLPLPDADARSPRPVKARTAPVEAHPPRSETRPALWLCLAAAALALIATLPMPYGYYGFLRYALSTAAILVAVFALRSSRPGWVVLSVPMFILWAPAVWVPLSRETWIVLDLLFAVALITAGILIPAPAERAGDDGEVVLRWPWWKVAGAGIAVAVVIAIVFSGNGGGNPDCLVVYDGRLPSCE